jgi:hypothetical protein
MFGKAITYKTTTKCLADNRTTSKYVGIDCPNLVVFVYVCTTNFHSGQCIVVNAEFLKFVGPKGVDFWHVRQKPHTLYLAVLLSAKHFVVVLYVMAKNRIRFF